MESEQVEEENDALNDMRAELGDRQTVEKMSQYFAFISGLHKDAEDELVEEMMPSCCLLNALDCLFMNLSSYCKDKTKPQDV